MPEVAWEGQGLGCLLSLGCCFPPPRRPPAWDKGQDVGDSPSVDRIWDGHLRPGVYHRIPPTF